MLLHGIHLDEKLQRPGVRRFERVMSETSRVSYRDVYCEPIQCVGQCRQVRPIVRVALQELRIYRPALALGKPLRLDTTKSPPLKFDPELPAGGVSPPPLDAGRLPSLDIPSTGGVTPPSLGGIGAPPLGGGTLGGVRGRLGR